MAKNVVMDDDEVLDRGSVKKSKLRLSSTEPETEEPKNGKKTTVSDGDDESNPDAENGAADEEEKRVKDDEKMDVDEDDDQEEEVYEVDKILDHKKKGGKLQYYVSWVGYDQDENSWIPEENAIGCDELIDEYWNSKKKKAENVDSAKRRRSSKPLDAHKDTHKKSRKSAVLDNPPPGGDKVKSTNEASAIELEFKPIIDEQDLPYHIDDWDDLIIRVDTIERTDEGGFMVYLVWKNGSRTAFENVDARRRCPQRLLDFYEEHTRFQTPKPDEDEKEETSDETTKETVDENTLASELVV